MRQYPDVKIVLAIAAIVTFAAVALSWAWGPLADIRQAGLGLALLTAALFWPPSTR